MAEIYKNTFLSSDANTVATLETMIQKITNDYKTREVTNHGTLLEVGKRDYSEVIRRVLHDLRKGAYTNQSAGSKIMLVNTTWFSNYGKCFNGTDTIIAREDVQGYTEKCDSLRAEFFTELGEYLKACQDISPRLVEGQDLKLPYQLIVFSGVQHDLGIEIFKEAVSEIGFGPYNGFDIASPSGRFIRNKEKMLRR